MLGLKYGHARVLGRFVKILYSFTIVKRWYNIFSTIFSRRNSKLITPVARPTSPRCRRIIKKKCDLTLTKQSSLCTSPTRYQRIQDTTHGCKHTIGDKYLLDAVVLYWSRILYMITGEDYWNACKWKLHFIKHVILK